MLRSNDIANFSPKSKPQTVTELSMLRRKFLAARADNVMSNPMATLHFSNGPQDSIRKIQSRSQKKLLSATSNNKSVTPRSSFKRQTSKHDKKQPSSCHRRISLSTFLQGAAIQESQHYQNDSDAAQQMEAIEKSHYNHHHQHCRRRWLSHRMTRSQSVIFRSRGGCVRVSVAQQRTRRSSLNLDMKQLSMINSRLGLEW